MGFGSCEWQGMINIGVPSAMNSILGIEQSIALGVCFFLFIEGLWDVVTWIS